MTAIAQSARGLGLLVSLNWDRLLYALTIAVALVAGSWLGTLGLN